MTDTHLVESLYVVLTHKLAISLALLGSSLIVLIADRIQELVFGGAAVIGMSIVAFVVSRNCITFC
jgi:hypothetical protein